MSTIYPFNAVRLADIVGDSFNYTVTVADNSGAAVDLSGATFDFILGSLTEGSSGVTITGNSSGVVTIDITSTAMAAITQGTYDIALAYTITTTRETLMSGTYEALEKLL